MMILGSLKLKMLCLHGLEVSEDVQKTRHEFFGLHEAVSELKCRKFYRQGKGQEDVS